MLIRLINRYKKIDLKTKTAIFLLLIFTLSFTMIELITLADAGYDIIISAIFSASLMSIGVYEVLTAFNLNRFTVFFMIFGLIFTMLSPFIYLVWLFLFHDVAIAPYVHMSWSWISFAVFGIVLIPLFFDRAFIYSRSRIFTLIAIIIILFVSEAAAKFILILMSVHIRDAVYFLLISVITDTAASVFGKLLGKRLHWKLAPKISPNKTIIGFLFGYLFGVAFAIGAYQLPTGGLFFTAGEHAWTLRIIFGFTAPLIAVIGDLFFSAIKRLLFVKDFSALIPGHGGIFDRIDSHVFVLAYSLFFYGVVYLLPEIKEVSAVALSAVETTNIIPNAVQNWRISLPQL